MDKLNELIEVFNLSEQQRAPVLLTDKNVIVSAGAGSGKTRTLVARYAALLYQYQDPRRVVAITFSEKAALEMRSRVRSAIATLIRAASNQQDRDFWVAMNQKVDSARISTIHSLCAEILRNHPSDAAIDPRSEILVEAESAAIVTQLVQDTVQVVAGDPNFAPLFENIKIRAIKKMVKYFLSNRLRIVENLGMVENYHLVVADFFANYLQSDTLQDLLSYLSSISHADLLADNREQIVTGLLDGFEQVNKLVADGDFNSATHLLWKLRKENMRLTPGKSNSPIKDALREIQTNFEDAFWSVPTDKEGQELLLDPDYEVARGCVIELFHLVRQRYENYLRDNQKLDFDSLEFYAHKLLQNPRIRAYWQSEISSLLVDEFQDTNSRQRQLVEALTSDRPGKLFMVGDARQSIYRFRQADVAVFRDVQEQTSKNGYALELDVSYRTIEPLIKATGVILSNVMGENPKANKPYAIQYNELVANRKGLPDRIQPPLFDVLIAMGAKEDKPRVSMGRMLAEKLLQMRNNGEIKEWDEVAILCRAGRSYQYYEDALADYNIPYITVAGRGFYQRAEVRDVLNILRALADPADDLAMAGFLRSPVIGVSDAGLYQMRKDQLGGLNRYSQAISQPHPLLSMDDQDALRRASEVLLSVQPLVDRVPVYELLKTVIDQTHYRAILARSQGKQDSGREWRNIDKLVNDCQTAKHLILKQYLDYVDSLDQDGVRSGEAPAESIGAVTIMTIHKSKGLEYPVIVLGDAGRMANNKGPDIFLDDRSGLVFRTETNTLHYKAAQPKEEDQQLEEDNRLLYVALTRAKDKVIISGHISISSQIKVNGWLAQVISALNIEIKACKDVLQIGENFYNVEIIDTPLPAPFGHEASFESQIGLLPEPKAAFIFEPIDPPSANELPDLAPSPASPRVSGFFFDESARVEGSIIHKAIELGLDVLSQPFDSFINAYLSREGIIDSVQRNRMIQRVQKLLTRFSQHPISQQIKNALEQHHELPYTYLANSRLENGIIDLVYRDQNGWTLLDFKTNLIDTSDKKAYLIEKYRPQIDRYADVLSSQYHITVRKVLCFLDDHAGISIEEII